MGATIIPLVFAWNGSLMRSLGRDGFSGPVLWIDAQIKSYRAFDPDFDPEVRYQGKVDLTGAVEERRFTRGDDTLTLYRLPEEVRCQ